MTMPPAPPAKRKAPAFKPPRPVHAATKAPTAKTTTAKPSAARGASTAKKASGVSGAKTAQSHSHGGFKPAAMNVTAISSDDDNQEDDMEVDESEEEVAEQPDASQEEVKPAIPPKLLARLLHEGFEDKEMKIGKEAMAVVGKYMETFVREAIARAGYERREQEDDDGIGDGFLQVEDLEKLAPQLLLDF